MYVLLLDTNRIKTFSIGWAGCDMRLGKPSNEHIHTLLQAARIKRGTCTSTAPPGRWAAPSSPATTAPSKAQAFVTAPDLSTRTAASPTPGSAALSTPVVGATSASVKELPVLFSIQLGTWSRTRERARPPISALLLRYYALVSEIGATFSP